MTSIVIPVRGTNAKSRLDHPLRSELARAMALDTIAAAVQVADVIVVTDETMRLDAESLGARTVADEGHGLNRAIESGLGVISTGSITGVLLGDIPALDPAELREALEAAAAHPLAMVADADGSGTVLVVAQPGIEHRVAFGVGSRGAHLANGYVELLDPWVTLRRDIDRVQQLHGLTLGPRTAALLA